jgi:predicted acetyltransferase
MKLEIIKATLDQKPVLANLLELYSYEFSEFHDFDVGSDGLYGYNYLSLYWTEVSRSPYLIYVEDGLAGFALVKKGCSISGNLEAWDMAEFFVMKKYKRQGVGTAAALKIWQQLKGNWQIRVSVKNQVACLFWLQTIKAFVGEAPKKTNSMLKGTEWITYQFESRDRT